MRTVTVIHGKWLYTESAYLTNHLVRRTVIEIPEGQTLQSCLQGEDIKLEDIKLEDVLFVFDGDVAYPA